jgi:dTDP-4-amino-4,6-dideoxygalactose transaminase
MKVSFLDLQAPYLEIQDDLDEALSSFFKSGQYIGGSCLRTFEQNYANFVGAKSCVGLANGLEAIEISLKALGVGAGDEVIVPSHTFIATWLAVSNCGAVPVPVEPDAKTYSIDINKIKHVITNKTKAIIPVHLYGQPVNLDPIINLAKSNDIYVIEDAAQAHGAFYKGKRIGSHGDVVAWSFYPGKNLGAFGDGGAITTNNLYLAEKIRALGNYGSKEKYVNDVIGVNSRLDPLQAVILDVKLKRLDEWNNRRKKIAEKYLDELKGLDLILPDEFDLESGAWHLFPVRSAQRDKIMQSLKTKDIHTIIHYPIPPHRQKAYASLFDSVDLKLAEEMSLQLFSLPIGPHLGPEETDFVIEAIKDYVG